MTTDPDLAIIDEMGVQSRGRCPGDQPGGRQKMADQRGRSLTIVGRSFGTSPARVNDTCIDGQPGWPTFAGQGCRWWLAKRPLFNPGSSLIVDVIDGPNAASKVEAAIAERDVHIAGQEALALSHR